MAPPIVVHAVRQWVDRITPWQGSAWYRTRMNRRVAIYCALLALGVVALIFTSGAAGRIQNRLAYAGLVPQRNNESDPTRAPMLKIYDQADHRVPAGATIFLGDSIAFKAPFGGPCFANRGIGGERSDQLLANLDRWPSIDRAGAVIVAIGTNDVWQWRADALGPNVAAILDRIEAPVTLIGLTADIDGIEQANAVLRGVCREGCTFLLPVGARAEDGIHLTANGYAQIAGQAGLRCR